MRAAKVYFLGKSGRGRGGTVKIWREIGGQRRSIAPALTALPPCRDNQGLNNMKPLDCVCIEGHNNWSIHRWVTELLSIDNPGLHLALSSSFFFFFFQGLGNEG